MAQLSSLASSLPQGHGGGACRMEVADRMAKHVALHCAVNTLEQEVANLARFVMGLAGENVTSPKENAQPAPPSGAPPFIVVLDDTPSRLGQLESGLYQLRQRLMDILGVVG